MLAVERIEAVSAWGAPLFYFASDGRKVCAPCARAIGADDRTVNPSPRPCDRCQQTIEGWYPTPNNG